MSKERLPSTQLVKSMKEVMVATIEPLGQFVLSLLEVILGKNRAKKLARNMRMIVK